MKNKILLILLFSTLIGKSQSNFQTINVGGISAINGSVSVGEIFLNNTTNVRASTGIVAIATQINQQSLLNSQFEQNPGISVYPNPTSSKLTFTGLEKLEIQNILVYNNLGQIMKNIKLDADYSINIGSLASGIYHIQLVGQDIRSFKIVKH